MIIILYPVHWLIFYLLWSVCCFSSIRIIVVSILLAVLQEEIAVYDYEICIVLYSVQWLTCYLHWSGFFSIWIIVGGMFVAVFNRNNYSVSLLFYIKFIEWIFTCFDPYFVSYLLNQFSWYVWVCFY